MASNTKRKRGANFQPSDISLLFDIVSQYIDIIESKKTDKVNNLDKTNAWGEVLLAFNARTTGVHRNLTELKNAWNNKKGQTRKNAAKEKKEIFATGGGVADIPKTDNIEESMRAILGPSLHGHSNEFDSDAFGLLQPSANENSTPVDFEVANSDSCVVIELDSTITDDSLETVESSNSGEASSHAPTWQKWNPTSLKLPVSEVLQIAAKGDKEKEGSTSSGKKTPNVINSKKRRPSLYPSSVDEINKAKQDYLEVQKKLALEQDAREARLFTIRCEKEQLEKELLELKVKKMRAEMGSD